MKIGYILKIFPKISETFVVNEIMELIKMGHSVYIFSMYHPNEKIIHREKIVYDDVLKYSLLDNTYYSPRIHRSVLELTGYVSLLLNRHPDNMLYNVLYTDVARHFAKIIREKDIHLDIIHAHFATEQTFVAMKLSKMLGIPFTLMAHANDIFLNPNVKSLREKFENASAIMTPSHYNREYLHSLTGVDKEKIHIVRACPNIDKFKDFKIIECKLKNELTILSISRLVEKKGIKYGILAIKDLVKEYPDIVYNIVGSGMLESELKMLITSLDLDNNVRIIGNLDDDVLIKDLSNATIFILPCVIARNGDMDGIPVSLMEAMYFQVPTISTRVSGISELIENNEDGLLVDAHNVKQLSDAIRTLLVNKDLRIKIGNRGKQKIETHFNIHKEAKILIEVWNRIKNESWPFEQ